jgi:coenzyme F420-reducing hydrogenase beta subunit
MKDHATINFESEGGQAHIVLYNDMGVRIKDIYQNEIQKGKWSVNLERGTLTTGTYYFTIYIENKSASGKLIVD